LEDSFNVKSMPYLSDTPLRDDVPVTRSLPIFLWGLALPKADPRDVYSLVYGLCKRVIQVPPPPKKVLMKKFKGFVHRWIRENLTPVRSDADLTYEHWRDSTSYSKSRKKQLDELNEETKHLTWNDIIHSRKYTNVKSHQKDEFYSEYKMPRWINSRHDLFKIRSGPIFKQIEKIVFQNPLFIKYVPVRDRAQWIIDNIQQDGGYYYATDYSSFESLFTPRLMKACEMQLYEFMTRDLDAGHEWYESMKYVLCEKPYTLGTKDVKCDLTGTRMSGEMNTSLGNGFTNAMITLFMLRESGVNEHRAVFEGDDGLLWSPVQLTAAVPEQLGLRIKMEEYTNLEDAAFCGNRFNLKEKIIVRNPIEYLAYFGWSKATQVKLRDSKLDVVLRSKAYSLRYQYNGCPILASFANYVLRVTKRAEAGISKNLISDRTLSEWERDLAKEAVADAENFVELRPGKGTRALVDKLYGINPSDQIELEKYFDNLATLGAIEHPILKKYAVLKPQWSEYFSDYQVSRDTRENPLIAIKGAIKNTKYAKGEAKILADIIKQEKYNF